jgi:Fic family protein
MEGDRPVSGNLYASQQARAFLENLQVSKKTGPESKVLALPEIEEKLEAIIRIHGEEEINRVRNRARDISRRLDMHSEFGKLDQLIGALLATRDSKILSSPLADPFRKAAFMMFMISEVHPFLDGNGRIARIMMNAELVAAGRSKMIIPTVYRDDYLVASRRLSRGNDPVPYIRML